MKRFYVLALFTLCIAQSILACKITIVNDTESTIFAYDDGANEGAILAPGAQGFYGEKGRHPSVTLYIPATPADATFKKAYNITQIACALQEEDKIVSVSAIRADTFSKDIYTVTNFTTGTDVPPCCSHHGSHMNHGAGAVDLLEVDMEKK